MTKHDVPLHGAPGDTVKATTCYMCACRCGIKVHLRNGKVRYIEGNRDHPVNKGVLCAKGSAGIMQHYAPSRLKAPMLRTGPRGSGEFKEITWDEAFDITVSWLKPIRATNPRKLAFFTGRDQSQSLTSWWAQQFGTPNYAAHGGFCSVNMATAGIYTVGGAFWEFGSPDWDRAKLFVIFGVAEDHDSNPIKTGIAKLKERGARIISVNPVRTGYSAVADDWVGIRPGTDGLFILSLIHELLRTHKVDLDYLIRYSNAPWLVIDDPEAADDGLIARDGNGVPLVIDRATGNPVPHTTAGVKPALTGTATLADGRYARPAFTVMAKLYLDPKYAPDAVAKQTGVDADTIRGVAAEMARVAFEEEIVLDRPWTDMKGERHEKMIGRPVAMHAMRGISAHSNGFQTCRAIHLLQVLLGSVEVPGGFRFKPPYPKPWTAHPKPTGRPADTPPDEPLAGPHLGYPSGPQDLLVEADGSASRIDKAFSWEAPLSAHGLMHMVISNAHAGDPYPVDALFLYMANMAWNSSMNTGGVIKMLEDKDEATGEYKIPKIIYSDAYASEMVAYADLILPDTTYLERHDCISLLDRPICEPDAVADAIRYPVVEPDRDVRGFQSALIQLGGKLGLPGFVNEDGSPKYADYADYMVNHQRKPGIGPLAGWRGEDGEAAGRGAPNPKQIDRYIENGGFWMHHIPDEAQFYKHANKAYQDFAVSMGFFDAPQPVTFDVYSEVQQKFVLAGRGHGDRQPPEHLRQQVLDSFAPLPIWYPPFEGELVSAEEYPLHALTQRPMAMYHSWGSQNAWLRQLYAANMLYVPAPVCDKYGIEDGGWAYLTSPHGRIKVPVRRMEGVNPDTVWTWNAIGKRSGAWALDADAPEARKGFLLNHLIHELLPPRGDGLRWANSDPVTGQAAWFDLKVRIEKAPAGDEVSEPQFPTVTVPHGPVAPDELRYGQDFSPVEKEKA
ncbi:MAG: molybdopterin oxidoreductase family protein [Rhodobiaceae bacterium]|nr:molybdopterin oxidoreductase family protein [Rhodobiaceae bacterium]